MKKESWLLLVGICSFCIIFYAVTMFPQDIMFSEYKKEFSEIQHPAKTELIKVYNSFGTLDKIRVVYKDNLPQGCDYRVGEVRKYSDTRESIKAFYTSKTIIVNGQEKSTGVMFIPTDSTGRIDIFGLPRDESIKWGPEGIDILENLKDDQTLGLLKLEPLASYYFISSGGFSLSNLDFRCQF